MKASGIISVVLMAACLGWMICFCPEILESGKTSRVAEMKVKRRQSADAAAFWTFAVVPEPLAFRSPASMEIMVAELPVPPVDHAALITRLLQGGDERALNEGIAEWYEVDSSAARDWLASQEDLDRFEPAIHRIALYLSRSGSAAYAMEWVKLLPEGAERDRTIFDIYAFAARSHQFSGEELRGAPLPQDQIAKLLSGVADD